MPNKKIFVTLILCLSILLAVGIWQWKTNIKIIQPIVSQSSISQISTATDTSSTNTDWQGLLLNTVGTTTNITDSSAGNFKTETNNLTAQMAQSYFGQFLDLSQSGQTVTDDNANQIAENTISSTDIPQAKVYTEQDLKIVPTNSQTIDNYYNAFGQTLQKNSIIEVGNELDIVNQASISESETDIAQLDPIIAGYQNILNDSIKMSVPSEAEQIHLEFVNNLSLVLVDLQNMRQIVDDPVKGLIGVKPYQNDYTNFDLSLQKIGAYFKIKGY